MQAIQVTGGGQFSLMDVPQPVPTSDEVLIRVHSTGICGTDIEIVDGIMAYFTMGLAEYPIIPGHEWSGEIVELGSDVTGFEVGDHVVGECSVGCGQCMTCLSGNYHQCASRTETGIMNRNGGFAEYMTFPALFLHRYDATLPYDVACLVEPTAIALNGILRTNIGPRDFVAIYGDGPIGLLTLQLTRVYGARKVALIGAKPDRLEAARKIGADLVLNATTDNITEALRGLNGGQLPDAVIEATGNPNAIESALMSVRPGGRYTVLGLTGGKEVNLNTDYLVVGDIVMRGALGSPGIWPDVIQLIESGRIDPGVIISHRLSLSEFGKGIELLKSGKDSVLKVVLTQN